MSINNSLYIPKEMLIIASGLDEKEISRDEADNVLCFVDGFIDYRSALVYVDRKWKEGKSQMFPPYSEDPNSSFASRVLGLIDDEIATGGLKMEWKKR